MRRRWRRLCFALRMFKLGATWQGDFVAFSRPLSQNDVVAIRRLWGEMHGHE